MAPDPVEADLSLPSGATRCVCRPDARVGVEELRLEMDAVPPAIRVVRTTVQAWATRAGLTPDAVDALVLAVDEAVTNVIDHARPAAAGDAGCRRGQGSMVLRAAGRPCGSGIAITVDDDGTWRPPPANPGHRGRGVRLIGQLADRSTITVTAHGTTVRMCWALP